MMRKVGPSKFVFDNEHEEELKDGLKFAELNGRIRELEESRDEWKLKYELSENAREAWEMDSEWFAEKLADATVDELALVQAFVNKLMGEGRTEHGALDLDTDERDLIGEAKDELTDTISYLEMEARRSGGGKELDEITRRLVAELLRLEGIV